MQTREGLKEVYTPSQVNRALAQERLLKGIEAGQAFESLCREVGLSLSRGYLSQLRRRYLQGGSSWLSLVDHRHGHAWKVTPERQGWLCEERRQAPGLTQQQLAQRFQEQFDVAISQSQVSKILRGAGIAWPGGQRFHSPGEPTLPVERAGVFFPPSRRVADGGVEHCYAGCLGAANSLPGA